MLNPRLAGRYAKSLIGLAIEKDQLDEVYNDMKYLQAVSKSNPDFVAVLKSPVITADKKEAIFKAISEGKTGKLTNLFTNLLIKKGRESNLPEITNAFIEQYNHHNEIFKVRLVTAVPVSEEVKKELLDKVRSQSPMKHIELTAEVDESLIGGFVLQIGDQLIDASISYDLHTIGNQFLKNDFIYKIR